MMQAENREKAGHDAMGGGITLSDITDLLPDYNCKECGYKSCRDFAGALAHKSAALDLCKFLVQARFHENQKKLGALLNAEFIVSEPVKTAGVIDGYTADFVLEPLPGECSCRETLFPFYRKDYQAGDLIRYRPLGCPLPHFARIIDECKGLITVHIIGPCHQMENGPDMEFEDIGVCMVGGFTGIVNGARPKIGQTVRFLPDGCMMQKVHSGVVVQLENSRAIIEGIDLKVWGMPELCE